MLAADGSTPTSVSPSERSHWCPPPSPPPGRASQLARPRQKRLRAEKSKNKKK